MQTGQAQQCDSVPAKGSHVKPPFTYYGGKLSIAGQIVALLPQHLHYVEPFAGSLAVLLAKPPSPMETVNDIDERLMTFWRVLRNRPAELARAAALTPHSRAEHLEAYRHLDTCSPADDELETARCVWVLLTQARGGSLRRKGWRYYVNPRGSSCSMPDYLEAYVERITPAAQRLHAVSLEARPALEIIEKYGAHDDVLIYADPPYLAKTRSSNRSDYRCDMGDETRHRELAEALRAAAAAVVLSGYHSPLYDELYRGWHVHEIATGTGQGGSYDPRTEVLWSNRPLGSQPTLFDPPDPAAPADQPTTTETR